MHNILFKTPSNPNEYEQYDYFRWKILRKPLGKTVESLKDSYEDSSYHLIGTFKDEVIACGRLHFNNKTDAQIRYMAVDKKFQGMGIGKKIIQLLELKAREKIAKKVVLNARDHVVEFYKKSGYKIVKKYEGSDTGIPHTTMEKKI